jgi:predicted component of type VI protein secretion system
MDLYMSPDAGRAGVSLIPAYALFEEHESAEHPSWAAVVAGMRDLSQSELRQMKLPEKYTKGYTFTTLVRNLNLNVNRRLGV